MNDEPLVKLVTSKRLTVDPIWETPIDDIEGPLYRSYIADNPGYDGVYVRREVAIRLSMATKLLPERYRLIIRAGHRPLAVQLRLLTTVQEQYMREHPGVSIDAALAFARTYVSDPAVKLPPHCCGAAIDVDLLDIADDRLVDFGCPVNTDSEIAFLNSPLLSEGQAANRRILHTAMLAAGFAPFQAEWWHFSYGDQVWADAYRAEAALYDMVEVIG